LTPYFHVGAPEIVQVNSKDPSKLFPKNRRKQMNGDPLVEVRNRVKTWMENPTLLSDAAYKGLQPIFNEFFDRHVNEKDPGRFHDDLFSALGPLSNHLLGKSDYRAAQGIWNIPLNWALEWEVANAGKRIHKGVPLFAFGNIAIHMGELSKGFLLLHAALDEDRRKHGGAGDPYTPALIVVTLDTSGTTDTGLVKLLQPAIEELEKHLQAYRDESGSALTLRDFQTKYTNLLLTREVAFIFTYALFQKIHLSQITSRFDFGKKFGAQLCTNCLFDLCQVVEESIRMKGVGGLFFAQATQLANRFGWQVTVIPGKNGTPNAELRDINNQQNSNFDLCIQQFFDGTIKAFGRPPVSVQERDLWLTYAIRNSSAHTLESKLVVHGYIESIFAAIAKTLFKVVDALYH